MKHLPWILSFCLFSGGCRFAHFAAQTAILEPLRFAECIEEKLERSRHRRAAAREWSIVQAQLSGPISENYARGFHDGFVDFMMAGGLGELPSYPPKDYWKSRYQTPAGHAAIFDWYAGFEHGAAVADENGYRDLVTLPLPAYWGGQPHGTSAEDKHGAYETSLNPPMTYEQSPKLDPTTEQSIRNDSLNEDRRKSGSSQPAVAAGRDKHPPPRAFWQ